MREEWLRRLALLKAGLIWQISSEKLLQISKYTFQSENLAVKYRVYCQIS